MQDQNTNKFEFNKEQRGYLEQSSLTEEIYSFSEQWLNRCICKCSCLQKLLTPSSIQTRICVDCRIGNCKGIWRM